MVKHKYECWKTPDLTEITFTTAENALTSKQQGLIPQDAFMEYCIEADTWEEACSIHNLRQGWGVYKPMGESQPCPQCNSWFYPEGSGECWRCGKIC